MTSLVVKRYIKINKNPINFQNFRNIKVKILFFMSNTVLCRLKLWIYFQQKESVKVETYLMDSGEGENGGSYASSGGRSFLGHKKGNLNHAQY